MDATGEDSIVCDANPDSFTTRPQNYKDLATASPAASPVSLRAARPYHFRPIDLSHTKRPHHRLPATHLRTASTGLVLSTRSAVTQPRWA